MAARPPVAPRASGPPCPVAPSGPQWLQGARAQCWLSSMSSERHCRVRGPGWGRHRWPLGAALLAAGYCGWQRYVPLAAGRHPTPPTPERCAGPLKPVCHLASHRQWVGVSAWEQWQGLPDSLHPPVSRMKPQHSVVIVAGGWLGPASGWADSFGGWFSSCCGLMGYKQLVGSQARPTLPTWPPRPRMRLWGGGHPRPRPQPDRLCRRPQLDLLSRPGEQGPLRPPASSSPLGP